MLPFFRNPLRRELRRIRTGFWWETSAIPTVVCVAVVLLVIVGLMARH